MLLVLVLACVCVCVCARCPLQGLEVIGAMQDGMGILSYLKYWALTGSPVTLRLASQLGDFLITQTLTAPLGPYANITRSSGFAFEWPETFASQNDMFYGASPRLGCVCAGF